MTHPEDAHLDPWHWLVVRPNGEEIEEYTEAGHANFSKTIEGPVEKIALLPAHPDIYPGLQPVVLLVPEGSRPIVFRSRQAVVINDPDQPIPEHVRITGIGWQKTIAGRNQQTLIALYDDGSMTITDDRARV